MPLASYELRVILLIVPRIEVLDGDIVITINTRDHLPPHVHVRFGGKQVLIAIDTSEVMHGGIARAQEKRAQKWVRANRARLRREWAKWQAQGKGES
jgi:predicted GTPase